MTNMLRGTELTGKLHQDHLNAKAFMREVAEEVEPVYDSWIATHSWDEIPLSEQTIIPSLWRGLDSEDREIFRVEDYEDICSSIGISNRQLKIAFSSGLKWYGLNAGVSDLLDEPDLPGLYATDVHQSDYSILSRDQLVSFKPGGDNFPVLGETILTNIGEGDFTGFQALHNARVRCAKFVTTEFQPVLRALSNKYYDMTESLSQCIVGGDHPDYQRPHYNPLAHSVLEGMMSTGQAVNYLIQPGVPGQHSVQEDAKSVLANHLPAVMSRAVINAHLGPNQMAGLSVRGALVRTNRDLQINPRLLGLLRNRRDAERASLEHMSEEDVKFMNRPDAQSVNRFEGCPANRLVRLTDRMLFDAVSVNA